MSWKVKAVLAATLVTLILILLIQNAGTADIHFLGWTVTIPALLLYIMLFGAGVVVGLLGPVVWKRGKRKADAP